MARMIVCKGYQAGNPTDGYEFDCGYENAGAFNCEDCICNGGTMSPQTGKKFRGNPAPYVHFAQAEAEARALAASGNQTGSNDLEDFYAHC